MMRLANRIIPFSWALILVSTTVNADYLEVNRSANLKREPTSDGSVIRNSQVGEAFELLEEGKQFNGYYKIWLEPEKDEAYIYRTLVRRNTGDLPNESANSEMNSSTCGDHLQFGIPTEADQILCRKGYAVGYDYTYKVPEWVSYKVTAGSRDPDVKRRNKFVIDEEIAAEHRSTKSDYSRSGYDQGHMAPSAIITFSQSANDETFFYTNMTPQLPGFNRAAFGRTGVWGQIEDDVRKWISSSKDELFVIAGTHFDDGYSTIGPNEVGIPSFFYKIIYDPSKSEAIAFWMPQDEDSADKIESYIKSIDYIEEQTGADFFNELNDGIEELLEADVQDFAEWTQ